jgi:hypothetical protein
VVDGFKHHLGSVQGKYTMGKHAQHKKGGDRIVSPFCAQRGVGRYASYLFLAWSTWSTMPAREFVNVSAHEYPIAADLFTLDCAFLRQLTHSAGRDVKHGGDFIHVHEIQFSLHTVKCTYSLACVTLLYAI